MNIPGYFSEYPASTSVSIPEYVLERARKTSEPREQKIFGFFLQRGDHAEELLPVSDQRV